MKLPYIKLLQVRRFKKKKKKHKIKTFSKIVPLKFGLDKIMVRIKVGETPQKRGAVLEG